MNEKQYVDGIFFKAPREGAPEFVRGSGSINIEKMKEFLGQVSVAEAMGNLYGTQIRIITALSGAISAAGFIAVQFKVFAEILLGHFTIKGVEIPPS